MALDIYDCEHIGFIPTQHMIVRNDVAWCEGTAYEQIWGNEAYANFYTEEDVIMRNDGTGVYIDVSRDSGEYFGRKHVGRGSTFADYDNDGDLDLIIVNLNDQAVLLRNDGGNRNNWILISTRLSNPDREAVGARVTVQTGSLKQVQDVVPVRGYLSQVDSRRHFGLGKAEKIDSIEIRWPNQKIKRLKNVSVNQILRVVEDSQ